MNRRVSYLVLDMIWIVAYLGTVDDVRSTRSSLGGYPGNSIETDRLLCYMTS